jgi:sec-independent protein translocase protein TatC
MALMDFLRRRNNTDNEMSFVDHLEALRGHIIRIAFVVLGLAILIFWKIDWLFDTIILGPIRKDFFSYVYLTRFSHFIHMGDALSITPVDITMQTTTFSGQFISSITIAMVGALVIGFPYVLWEIWRFIRPALKDNERKGTTYVIFWVSLFFFLGALFGYYMLAPYTFSFLANYHIGVKGVMVTRPTLDDYIENLTDIVLGCGLAFELPVVSSVLTRIGLITPAFLKTVRRYAYIVILFVAAIITPSPDWVSQTIVAAPLIALYEISISVSKSVTRRREEKDKEEWS